MYSKFDYASKITKLFWYFWYSFKLLIESWVFDIPSIFFITVPYMVNNINESHIFGQQYWLSRAYSTEKCFCGSVPISDRADRRQHRLFERYNHCQCDLFLLLLSHVQATDKRMGSWRFFFPAKITHHKIKNEMQGYHILQLGRPGIHTR